jgi:hypothetical protein
MINDCKAVANKQLNEERKTIWDLEDSPNKSTNK